MHLQRVAIIACTMTHLAGYIYIGQKVHLNLIHAIALAGLTATALHIEAKATGLIATHFGLVSYTKQLPD